MARKVVLIVLGVLLLVIGALAAIGGGALMALFGSNDTLSSGVQNVSTPTRALVSPAGLIQGASGAQTVVGSVRLRITATPTGAGHQLFLGIGPASAVDSYLSGVSYDVATDVSVNPFHLTLARHGGTAIPPPPGSQSFWVAQASGDHPTLTWTVTSGSYRVVVMNTDAAAPVAFAGGLDLTIPHSFAIGIGLLIGGIVLILIAIALIVLGVRTRARPPSQPVPDPPAGPLARPGRTGHPDKTRGWNPGLTIFNTGWTCNGTGTHVKPVRRSNWGLGGLSALAGWTQLRSVLPVRPDRPVISASSMSPCRASAALPSSAAALVSPAAWRRPAPPGW